MSKKDLANVSANLAELAETFPSQHVGTETIKKKGRAAKKKPRPKPKIVEESVIQFSLSLRKTLRKELMVLASDADMTMRAFVLNALKERGLSVSDADLLDRRRKE